MTTQPHILIVGAGYAGLTAALRLSDLAVRGAARVTLVNGADHFVERVRLHEAAAGRPPRARPLAHILRRSGVRFVRGWVTALDPDSRQIRLATEAGEAALAYDLLIYALGSTADLDSIPGARDHAVGIGDAREVGRLRAGLTAARPGGRVMVVGGGLTGIEAASEIAESHPRLHVTLMTAGALGAGLSARGAAHVRRVFDRLGIEVVEGQRVTQVEAGAVQTAHGARLALDLCVWAGSFRALPLAREAGLSVNARGQILVDAALRSLSHPEIYAAGDAAAFATGGGEAPGVPVRMACATGLPMGAQAADNVRARLAGESERAFGFGYFAQCISLGRRDGLIQFVQADDTPVERVLTGRLAVGVKELVCRFAARSAGTRWAARHYRWPRQMAYRDVVPRPSAPVAAGPSAGD
jgi:NADH dehydrogenase FAD-containing subunit